MSGLPPNDRADDDRPSDPDATERVLRLAEELLEADVDATSIDAAHWAERFEVDEADVLACLAAVGGLRAALGEDLLPSDVEPLPPPTLPSDYRLLGELGRGGMGLVYRVWQESLGREVALKVLRPGDLVFGDAIRRFRQEATSLARLRHRHIVSVHEVGEIDGNVYFTMDYVEGQSLARLVRTGRVTISRATAIVRQVTSAIAYAHSRGIVHRDLKPANILIDEAGDAFVVDFGLALDATSARDATLTGQVLGTPGYMSPEQARGDRERIGEATDIYALGVVLYEALTGVAPFADRGLAEGLQAVLHEEPVPPRQLNPRVSRDLEIVCLKALEKDPEDRYPTAVALLADLERFDEGKEILARKPRMLRRLGRRARAARSVVLTCLLTVAVLLPFVVILLDSRAERDALGALSLAQQVQLEGESVAARRQYQRSIDSGALGPKHTDWARFRLDVLEAVASFRAGDAEPARAAARELQSRVERLDTLSLEPEDRIALEEDRRMLMLLALAPGQLLPELDRIDIDRLWSAAQRRRPDGELSERERNWLDCDSPIDRSAIEAYFDERLLPLLRQSDGPYRRAAATILVQLDVSQARIDRLSLADLEVCIEAAFLAMELGATAHLPPWLLPSPTGEGRRHWSSDRSAEYVARVADDPARLASTRSRAADLLATIANLPLGGDRPYSPAGDLTDEQRHAIVSLWRAGREESEAERFVRAVGSAAQRSPRVDSHRGAWLNDHLGSPSAENWAQWWQENRHLDPRHWLLEALDTLDADPVYQPVEWPFAGDTARGVGTAPILPNESDLPLLVSNIAREHSWRRAYVWHLLARLTVDASTESEPGSPAPPYWCRAERGVGHAWRVVGQWRRYLGLEENPYRLRVLFVGYREGEIGLAIHWQKVFDIVMGEAGEIREALPRESFFDAVSGGPVENPWRSPAEPPEPGPRVSPRVPGLLRPSGPSPSRVDPNRRPFVHLRYTVECGPHGPQLRVHEHAVEPHLFDGVVGLGAPMVAERLHTLGSLVLFLEKPRVTATERDWVLLRSRLENDIVSIPRLLGVDGEPSARGTTRPIEWYRQTYEPSVRSAMQLAGWIPVPRRLSELRLVASASLPGEPEPWKDGHLLPRLLADDESLLDPDGVPSSSRLLEIAQRIPPESWALAVTVVSTPRLEEFARRWLRTALNNKGFGKPEVAEAWLTLAGETNDDPADSRPRPESSEPWPYTIPLGLVALSLFFLFRAIRRTVKGQHARAARPAAIVIASAVAQFAVPMQGVAFDFPLLALALALCAMGLLVRRDQYLGLLVPMWFVPLLAMSTSLTTTLAAAPIVFLALLTLPAVALALGRAPRSQRRPGTRVPIVVAYIVAALPAVVLNVAIAIEEWHGGVAWDSWIRDPRLEAWVATTWGVWIVVAVVHLICAASQVPIERTVPQESRG